MEFVEVKEEVADITLDLVKHELPEVEIKDEICMVMRDADIRPNNKTSGNMGYIELKEGTVDNTLGIVKHELPDDEITDEICIDMKDADFKPSADNKPKQGRKVFRLSLSKKLEIVQRYDKGETVTKLARDFKVHHSSVIYILKKKDEILKRVELIQQQHGNMDNVVNISGIEESKLEKCVYEWYIQQRRLKKPITGQIIREKALYFNKVLGGSSSFVASDGWCSKFKKRHGIRSLLEKKQKSAGNNEGSLSFDLELQTIIEDKGIKLENLYKGYETGLAYKTLPIRTLGASQETEAPERKIMKDRVTVLVCANATGSRKISPLVIGKRKKSHCLKNKTDLPLVYKAQNNAHLNKVLFLDWYKHVFLPEVKSHKDEGDKCLLLLDNASSHPTPEELNAIDPCCEIIYLPPNITALQPMEQGVISSLKREYRSHLLHKLVFQEIYNESHVKNFLISWTLLDCLKTLSHVWENIQSSVLKNAWNSLLHANEIEDRFREPCKDLLYLANKIYKDIAYTSEDILNWLNGDDWYPTFYEKTDDEEKVVSFLESAGEEEEENEVESSRKVPTSADALAAYGVIYNWLHAKENVQKLHHTALATIKESILKDILNTDVS